MVLINAIGGIYCTPTMQGSRSGAVVATAWATMLYFGLKFPHIIKIKFDVLMLMKPVSKTKKVLDAHYY